MKERKSKIKKTCAKFKIFCDKFLRVGVFLALKQIKKGSWWVNVLTIFIMMFTFLNLVVVNGILVGLVEGSSIAYREQFSGDVFIRKPEKKTSIEDSIEIMEIAKGLPEIKAISARYVIGGVVEANYKTRTDFQKLPEEVSAQITGIEPSSEDALSNLSGLVVEGQYLNEDDDTFILIGSNLLEQYATDIPGLQTLTGVEVGTKVRIFVAGNVQEMRVKGIVKSKIGEINTRVYMIERRARAIMGLSANNAQEIALRIQQGIEPEYVKENLVKSGISKEDAVVETWEESQGQFFKDISLTFNSLGLIIGLIGLIVASITIFIVIFINAITRRKYIGILKAIGICPSAIELAYMMQAFFYALFGSLIGLMLLYGFLKPYIDLNPIDFPFSDGILVAPLWGVALRLGLLFLISIVAGLIPARMVVKKNTLDSVLGR